MARRHDGLGPEDVVLAEFRVDLQFGLGDVPDHWLQFFALDKLSVLDLSGHGQSKPVWSLWSQAAGVTELESGCVDVSF